MRGFLVFLFLAIISAQVEAAICSHFDQNETGNSTKSLKVNVEDHSANPAKSSSTDDACLSCGHAHVILFKHGASAFKFLNNHQKVLDFQNELMESRSVPPPIDPPRV